MKINKEFNKNISSVKIDKKKMEQVFVNLLVNALQAMDDGGHVTARTSEKVFSENDLEEETELAGYFRHGESVIVVEFEDTGKGIPDEFQDKIKEPFFTTKSEKGGTGLGLAIINNIIELHEGKFFIKNREGGGARATVWLRV